MPSYHRSASPIYTTYLPSTTPSSISSSSYVLPTGLTSPKLSSATMPSPVMSRQPTNAQLWTLYHFETHALMCASCHYPYHVHRSGCKLCRTGRQLAESAAEILGVGQDKVEVPETYHQVRSLVKAMERSKRHPKQAPIVRVSRSSSTSSTERRAAKESEAASTTAVASVKKSKSTSPSPSPKPRNRRTTATSTETARSLSTSEPALPLKSILKKHEVSTLPYPTSPVIATPTTPIMETSSDMSPLPSLRLNIIHTATKKAQDKRQQGPQPARAATQSNYVDFDVEIREPRKMTRKAGVTRFASR